MDDDAARTTRLTQGRYNRYSRIYDIAEAGMERMMFARLRRGLWQRVRGDRLLEIGVGTGKNIPYYPAGGRVVSIDLSPGMLAHARRMRAPATLDLVLADAQHLPFRDGVFDTAISTFVFCSVPDPVAGLRDAARVLKTGGSLLLLEHVRAQNPLAGKVMDVVNLLWVRVFGANINRRTVQTVAESGFALGDVETFAPGIMKLIPAHPAALAAR